MPPVQRNLDGLWHCLRPAFTSSVSARICQISPLVRRFIKQNSTYPPSQCHLNPRKSIRRKTFSRASRPPVSSRGFLQTQLVQHVYSNLDDKPNRQIHNNQQIYEDLRRSAVKGDLVRVDTLVNEIVNTRGEKPDTRIYLALILVNISAQDGSPAEVRRLLGEMAKEEIVPDSAIYHAVLKVIDEEIIIDALDPLSLQLQVLAIHPDYLLRCEALEEMRRRWFTVSNDGWHDVIAGLLRDRQLELALDTLELLQREGSKIHPWLYDMVIYTLCDAGEFDQVLQIIRYRISSGELLISGTLWFYLLDTASRSLHHAATLYVWRKRVETSYLNPPSGICTNVLNTAARHGDFRLATDVFRILGNRAQTLHLHHYEALLESYLASSDLKTALTILSIMTSSGVPPSESSTRPIYTYLQQSPSHPQTALSILQTLRQSDRPIPPEAVNVIIEAFVHHKAIPSAIATYKTLYTLVPTGPTTSTFNILFHGCCSSGPTARKDLAMFLASEMVALKVAPDALTYDRLVQVCLNADGQDRAPDAYEDAWRYFGEMRGLGWGLGWGTMKAFVTRGCERGDERVWGVVEDMKREGGEEARGVEKVVMECWRGEERGMKEGDGNGNVNDRQE